MRELHKQGFTKEDVIDALQVLPVVCRGSPFIVCSIIDILSSIQP